MNKKLVSSISQDSIKTHWRVLTDVNDGLVSLLSNSEVFAVRMDSDRSNTVSISSCVGLVFMSSQVKSLVAVTANIDNDIVFQEMNVISLIGVLSKSWGELNISLRNGRIFDFLLDVVFRVVLVKGHYFLFFLLGSGFLLGFFFITCRFFNSSLLWSRLLFLGFLFFGGRLCLFLRSFGLSLGFFGRFLCFRLRFSLSFFGLDIFGLSFFNRSFRLSSLSFFCWRLFSCSLFLRDFFLRFFFFITH